MELKTSILTGDCLDILKKYPDEFFDLIVTSPPYADSREKTYGGIDPDEYVDWFIPRSEQFLRVLKLTGTFILNIKERVVNGERHTYVIELILALKRQGWLWTEEFVWHKKNCHPGKWPNRFRDAWERCLQFNKTKNFAMYQENVMVPMGDWAEKRLKNLGKNDVIRFDSKVKSGFGKNISNWIGRTMAYPTNVLHLSTETSNKSHSATFPKALPEWFIKLFTKEYDWILDPFLGSGTSCIAAQNLKRNSVGIEIVPEYCEIARREVPEMELILCKKSAAEGIDLEFEKADIKYCISIKSGPNWGNSQQINRMKDNFKKVRKILGSNSSTRVIFINGCCYGIDDSPDKGDYIKLCGQRFWQLISGDKSLYTEIIEPLGFKAKEKNQKFIKEYSKVVNRFTLEFAKNYCDSDGSILWEKLVKFNSGIQKNYYFPY